jgi:hypothetical protein
MSSLVCVGGGKHLVETDGGVVAGRAGWFMVLAFSFNFAGSPASPPMGVLDGPAGMLRGNTLYLSGAAP